MNITNGLVIASPHIERILEGRKTWEMRSTKTTKRGRIALIRKGSGLIVGTVELTGYIGPLTQQQMLEARDKHWIDESIIKSGEVDKWRYGWTLERVTPFTSPIAYVSSPGWL